MIDAIIIPFLMIVFWCVMFYISYYDGHRECRFKIGDKLVFKGLSKWERDENWCSVIDIDHETREVLLKTSFGGQFVRDIYVVNKHYELKNQDNDSKASGQR